MRASRFYIWLGSRQTIRLISMIILPLIGRLTNGALVRVWVGVALAAHTATGLYFTMYAQITYRNSATSFQGVRLATAPL